MQTFEKYSTLQPNGDFNAGYFWAFVPVAKQGWQKASARKAAVHLSRRSISNIFGGPLGHKVKYTQK
jgi:hypothetical protein